MSDDSDRMPASQPPKAAAAELTRALRAVLRPLVRVAVARGITLPQMIVLLKEALVDAAIEAQAQTGAQPTQSRTSVLTGVHRKDVRLILEAREAGEAAALRAGPGIAETVIGRWLADPALRLPDGTPSPLPLREDAAGEGAGRSFNALVRSISTDVRPRSVLDELVYLRLVEETGDGTVTLTGRAVVPSTEDARLVGYFGDNLADHAEAAAANLLAAPAPGPFLERAVFYNRLSEASIAELETLARKAADETLIALNEEARALQARDVAAGGGAGRIRYGVYFYQEPRGTAAGEEDAE